MKHLVLPLLLLALGCSVPHSIPEGGIVKGQSINPIGKVLILAVQDGQEQGQSPAPGSGRGMVAALRTVLMNHSIPFTTSDSMTNMQGFEEAQKLNFDYVMKCTITLWEDNATAWSGKGDKLKISVELFDVKSKQLVAVASHYRVSTGATFVSAAPDRFMDECAAGALGKIFGWTEK
jgi:hypothetical protein